MYMTRRLNNGKSLQHKLKLDSSPINSLVIIVVTFQLDIFELCIDINRGYIKFKDLQLEHV